MKPTRETVPIELQVLGEALRAVAEEMGAVLIRSAFSANIKERRDCSTAVFDERGRMIAQAEHIPVHLGAMPDAVAAVAAHEPAPGEVWILNDPFAGGTHLPDVTMVSRTALGYAVSRAHHADVGALEPGSMPAESRTLAEEGVVIPPTRLDERTLDGLVARMRNPEERRGDFRAQLAAHRLAEQRLEELCERRGRSVVAAAMDELYAYSERVVRQAIARLPDGRYEADGRARGPGRRARDRRHRHDRRRRPHRRLHRHGAAARGQPQLPAVGHALRDLLRRPLRDGSRPARLGRGLRAACEVVAPPGCLVNARPPAAVAAGNVETSSRIVDVLFAALGGAIALPAQGQGTVNNVTLGNDRFTYYETIGGGQGACPDGDGPSGVHVAMSNTLSTPTEALELQYPLRVERYALRLGSGGRGERTGGDGVVRELRVLEPCRLSLLTERRANSPRGARGGADGAVGRNLVNGTPVPAKATLDLAAGDVVTIETPGGGGFGPA